MRKTSAVVEVASGQDRFALAVEEREGNLLTNTDLLMSNRRKAGCRHGWGTASKWQRKESGAGKGLLYVRGQGWSHGQGQMCF